MNADDETEIYWKLREAPDWRPYCLVCSSMQRMVPREYGFMCLSCDNRIDRNMEHLV